MQGEGRVSELLLSDGESWASIGCAAGLIPGPGQYTLAHAQGSDAPLASVLFPVKSLSDGFIAAAPIPSTWVPGMRLHLRGPLGHGFTLPVSAQRIGLVAFKCSVGRLASLMAPALARGASVTLIAPQLPDDLPPEVEAQPLDSLMDICRWADFLAFDLPRERLPELRALLQPARLGVKAEGQALVHMPMPCGALAACGICTVEIRGKPLLACEDGPVFDLHQLMEWSSRA